MNKYQKKKSREIKAIMRRDKWGRLSYKDAKVVWKFGKRFNAFSPCEDCDNLLCFKKTKKAIVYCPERR